MTAHSIHYVLKKSNEQFVKRRNYVYWVWAGEEGVWLWSQRLGYEFQACHSLSVWLRQLLTLLAFSVVSHEGSKPLNILLERLPEASHAKCLSATLLSTGQRLSYTMIRSCALFPVNFYSSPVLYELLLLFYPGGNSPGKWDNFPTLSHIRNGELNFKSGNFVTIHTWVFCLFSGDISFCFPSVMTLQK